LVTTGVELTAGKHYWEVDILSYDIGNIFVGVTRPNLDPNGDYAVRESTDGWFMKAASGHLQPSPGSLSGNGKGNDPWENDEEPGNNDGEAGAFNEGGLVGVLLDLNEGSLRFFVNGVQHGPGYPAGSVTGPVVCAVQLYCTQTSFRLLPQHTGHALLQ
jgi:hypothetical protein